jgi:hypothetical protein
LTLSLFQYRIGFWYARLNNYLYLSNIFTVFTAYEDGAMLLSLYRSALVFGCLAAAIPALAGEPLPSPSGPVILIVSGKLGVTNAPGEARFDREMLASLPQAVYVSYTDWTNGPQRFEGVLLKDVIARIDGSGQEIVASALNDYKATIPSSDLDEYPVLLALSQNGAAMSVRDKGPIWMIYPDPEPAGEFVHQHRNAKMVWQLERLQLR